MAKFHPIPGFYIATCQVPLALLFQRAGKLTILNGVDKIKPPDTYQEPA